MIFGAIKPMRGPGRIMLARHVMAEARRRAWLVSSGARGFADVEADLLCLASALGILDGAEHEEAVSDEVFAAAVKVELAAGERVRDAVLPLIASRKPAAVIFAAAFVAARGDLPVERTRAITLAEMQVAVQALSQRRSLQHA